MKRSPLRRKTPLEPGGPIARSSPINQVSKKRRKVLAERRQFVIDTLARHPRCEAGPRVQDRAHRCQGTPSDVHEIQTRARGGSIVDPDNVVAVCRACHDWIHSHPAQATTLGLLASQYTPRED